MAPYHNRPETQMDDHRDKPVEIYSRQTVFWFALVFNPIFGGYLLMQNLRNVGNKAKGTQVFIFSIAAFLIPVVIIKKLALNAIIVVSLNVVANVPTAFILADYFFVKYFPDNDYYPKDTTSIFFRFVAIGLAAVFLLVYLGPIIVHKLK